MRSGFAIRDSGFEGAAVDFAGDDAGAATLGEGEVLDEGLLGICALGLGIWDLTAPPEASKSAKGTSLRVCIHLSSTISN